jgi:hypothetical protein
VIEGRDSAGKDGIDQANRGRGVHARHASPPPANRATVRSPNGTSSASCHPPAAQESSLTAAGTTAPA